MRGWLIPAAFTAALLGSVVTHQPVLEAGAAATYTIDNVHSSVLFKIRHAGTSNTYGRFNTVSGSYTIDDENAANSSISLEIDAASVDTNSEGRDKHLRSPDFFSVKQFPKITFTSTKIEKTAGGYHATGELDLHGVKKEIAFDFVKVGEGTLRDKPISGYEGKLSFKRSDFGMTKYVAEGTIGDEVEIIVSVEGAQG